MRRERTQKAWRTGCQSEGSNERERADTGAHPQGWLGAGWLQAVSGKQFADCLTECVKALGDEELDHTKLFACSSRFLSGKCVRASARPESGSRVQVPFAPWPSQA